MQSWHDQTQQVANELFSELDKFLNVERQNLRDQTSEALGSLTDQVHIEYSKVQKQEALNVNDLYTMLLEKPDLNGLDDLRRNNYRCVVFLNDFKSKFA